MLKTIAAGLALIALPLASASALTITNKDSKEHTIGLDMGDKESVHKIPGGGSVTFKDECKDACGVTGPWDFSVMLKTGDKWEFDGRSLISGEK